MITDALLLLASAQAVTASAVSTNTIDLKSARDPGRGDGITVAVSVDQTVTAAGAATVTFQIITSASAGLASPAVLVQTDAIGKAELTAGRRPFYLRVPREMLSTVGFGQRYLGLNFLVSSGPLTAGQFTAQVVANEQAGATAVYPQNRAIY